MLARLAQAAGVDEIVVIEGAHRLPHLPGTRGTEHAEADARRRSSHTARVRVVRADDWETGPGASLRAGLAALPDEATHAVVILADGPTLDPRAIDRLIEHRADADIVAASYDGTRSHPVVLARSTWGSIPDAGGRALEPALVDCSDLEPPGDVDYPPAG